MVMVGYVKNDGGQVYIMSNPVTQRFYFTCDVISLKHMIFQKRVLTHLSRFRMLKQICGHKQHKLQKNYMKNSLTRSTVLKNNNQKKAKIMTRDMCLEKHDGSRQVRQSQEYQKGL